MVTGTISAVAAVERDEGFWRAAYREHAGAVFGFLMRRVRQRAEAEDLLQETFVRAMRFDSFRGGNLRGYLMSIARNLIVNRLRRPRLVVPVETRSEEEQPFAEVAADGPSPERRAAWRRFEDKLHGVLAEMSDDHRRAFELAILEQHTYAEVSQITGWSLPRVRSNIHRARKKLVDRLGAELADDRGVLP